MKSNFKFGKLLMLTLALLVSFSAVLSFNSKRGVSAADAPILDDYEDYDLVFTPIVNVMTGQGTYTRSDVSKGAYIDTVKQIKDGDYVSVDFYIVKNTDHFSAFEAKILYDHTVLEIYDPNSPDEKVLANNGRVNQSIKVDPQTTVGKTTQDKYNTTYNYTVNKDTIVFTAPEGVYGTSTDLDKSLGGKPFFTVYFKKYVQTEISIDKELTFDLVLGDVVNDIPDESIAYKNNYDHPETTLEALKVACVTGINVNGADGGISTGKIKTINRAIVTTVDYSKYYDGLDSDLNVSNLLTESKLTVKDYDKYIDQYTDISVLDSEFDLQFFKADTPYDLVVTKKDGSTYETEAYSFFNYNDKDFTYYQNGNKYYILTGTAGEAIAAKEYEFTTYLQYVADKPDLFVDVDSCSDTDKYVSVDETTVMNVGNYYYGLLYTPSSSQSIVAGAYSNIAKYDILQSELHADVRFNYDLTLKVDTKHLTYTDDLYYFDALTYPESNGILFDSLNNVHTFSKYLSYTALNRTFYPTFVTDTNQQAKNWEIKYRIFKWNDTTEAWVEQTNGFEAYEFGVENPGTYFVQVLVDDVNSVLTDSETAGNYKRYLSDAPVDSPEDIIDAGNDHFMFYIDKRTFKIEIISDLSKVYHDEDPYFYWDYIVDEECPFDSNKYTCKTDFIDLVYREEGEDVGLYDFLCDEQTLELSTYESDYYIFVFDKEYQFEIVKDDLEFYYVLPFSTLGNVKVYDKEAVEAIRVDEYDETKNEVQYFLTSYFDTTGMESNPIHVKWYSYNANKTNYVGSVLSTAPKNAGTYTIGISVDATKNFNALTEKFISFKITPIIVRNPFVEYFVETYNETLVSDVRTPVTYDMFIAKDYDYYGEFVDKDDVVTEIPYTYTWTRSFAGTDYEELFTVNTSTVVDSCKGFKLTASHAEEFELKITLNDPQNYEFETKNSNYKTTVDEMSGAITSKYLLYSAEILKNNNNEWTSNPSVQFSVESATVKLVIKANAVFYKDAEYNDLFKYRPLTGEPATKEPTGVYYLDGEGENQIKVYVQDLQTLVNEIVEAQDKVHLTDQEFIQKYNHTKESFEPKTYYLDFAVEDTTDYNGLFQTQEIHFVLVEIEIPGFGPDPDDPDDPDYPKPPIFDFPDDPEDPNDDIEIEWNGEYYVLTAYYKQASYYDTETFESLVDQYYADNQDNPNAIEGGPKFSIYVSQVEYSNSYSKHSWRDVGEYHLYLRVDSGYEWITSTDPKETDTDDILLAKFTILPIDLTIQNRAFLYKKINKRTTRGILSSDYESERVTFTTNYDPRENYYLKYGVSFATKFGGQNILESLNDDSSENLTYYYYGVNSNDSTYLRLSSEYFTSNFMPAILYDDTLDDYLGNKIKPGTYDIPSVDPNDADLIKFFNGNYNITAQTNELVIEKGILPFSDFFKTFTCSPKTVTYDGDPHYLEPTYTLIDINTIKSNTGLNSITTDDITESIKFSYTIVDDDNVIEDPINANKYRLFVEWNLYDANNISFDNDEYYDLSYANITPLSEADVTNAIKNAILTIKKADLELRIYTREHNFDNLYPTIGTKHDEYIAIDCDMSTSTVIQEFNQDPNTVYLAQICFNPELFEDNDEGINVHEYLDFDLTDSSLAPLPIYKKINDFGVSHYIFTGEYATKSSDLLDDSYVTLVIKGSDYDNEIYGTLSENFKNIRSERDNNQIWAPLQYFYDLALTPDGDKDYLKIGGEYIVGAYIPETENYMAGITEGRYMVIDPMFEIGLRDTSENLVIKSWDGSPVHCLYRYDEDLLTTDMFYFYKNLYLIDDVEVEPKGTFNIKWYKFDKDTETYSELESAPIKAGSYRVGVTYTSAGNGDYMNINEEVLEEFEISKYKQSEHPEDEFTVDNLTQGEKVYDGGELEPLFELSLNTKTHTSTEEIEETIKFNLGDENLTYMFALKGSQNYTEVAPTTVGEYWFVVKVAANDDHEEILIKYDGTLNIYKRLVHIEVTYEEDGTKAYVSIINEDLENGNNVITELGNYYFTGDNTIRIVDTTIYPTGSSESYNPYVQLETNNVYANHNYNLDEANVQLYKAVILDYYPVTEESEGYYERLYYDVYDNNRDLPVYTEHYFALSPKLVVDCPEVYPYNDGVITHYEFADYYGEQIIRNIYNHTNITDFQITLTATDSNTHFELGYVYTKLIPLLINYIYEDLTGDVFSQATSEELYEDVFSPKSYDIERYFMANNNYNRDWFAIDQLYYFDSFGGQHLFAEDTTFAELWAASRTDYRYEGNYQVIDLYGYEYNNIGLGDVTGDGRVNADDLILYRLLLVGGYEDVTVPDYILRVSKNDLVNIAYFYGDGVPNYSYEASLFHKYVADCNLLFIEAQDGSETMKMGDSYLDVRDVATIAMAIAEGYGYHIVANYNGLRNNHQSVVCSEKLYLQQYNYKNIKEYLQYSNDVYLLEDIYFDEFIETFNFNSSTDPYSHTSAYVTTLGNEIRLHLNGFNIYAPNGFNLVNTNGSIKIFGSEDGESVGKIISPSDDSISIKAPNGKVYLENVELVTGHKYVTLNSGKQTSSTDQKHGMEFVGDVTISRFLDGTDDTALGFLVVNYDSTIIAPTDDNTGALNTLDLYVDTKVLTDSVYADKYVVPTNLIAQCDQLEGHDQEHQVVATLAFYQDILTNLASGGTGALFNDLNRTVAQEISGSRNTSKVNALGDKFVVNSEGERFTSIDKPYMNKAVRESDIKSAVKDNTLIKFNVDTYLANSVTLYSSLVIDPSDNFTLELAGYNLNGPFNREFYYEYDFEDIYQYGNAVVVNLGGKFTVKDEITINNHKYVGKIYVNDVNGYGIYVVEPTDTTKSGTTNLYAEIDATCTSDSFTGIDRSKVRASGIALSSKQYEGYKPASSSGHNTINIYRSVKAAHIGIYVSPFVNDLDNSKIYVSCPTVVASYGILSDGLASIYLEKDLIVDSEVDAVTLNEGKIIVEDANNYGSIKLDGEAHDYVYNLCLDTRNSGSDVSREFTLTKLNLVHSSSAGNVGYNLHAYSLEDLNFAIEENEGERKELVNNINNVVLVYSLETQMTADNKDLCNLDFYTNKQLDGSYKDEANYFSYTVTISGGTYFHLTNTNTVNNIEIFDVQETEEFDGLFYTNEEDVSSNNLIIKNVYVTNVPMNVFSLKSEVNTLKVEGSYFSEMHKDFIHFYEEAANVAFNDIEGHYIKGDVVEADKTLTNFVSNFSTFDQVQESFLDLNGNAVGLEDEPAIKIQNTTLEYFGNHLGVTDYNHSVIESESSVDGIHLSSSAFRYISDSNNSSNKLTAINLTGEVTDFVMSSNNFYSIQGDAVNLPLYKGETISFDHNEFNYINNNGVVINLPEYEGAFNANNNYFYNVSGANAINLPDHTGKATLNGNNFANISNGNALYAPNHNGDIEFNNNQLSTVHGSAVLANNYSGTNFTATGNYASGIYKETFKVVYASGLDPVAVNISSNVFGNDSYDTANVTNGKYIYLDLNGAKATMALKSNTPYSFSNSSTVSAFYGINYAQGSTADFTGNYVYNYFLLRFIGKDNNTSISTSGKQSSLYKTSPDYEVQINREFRSSGSGYTYSSWYVITMQRHYYTVAQSVVDSNSTYYYNYDNAGSTYQYTSYY